MRESLLTGRDPRTADVVMVRSKTSRPPNHITMCVCVKVDGPKLDGHFCPVDSSFKDLYHVVSR